MPLTAPLTSASSVLHPVPKSRARGVGGFATGRHPPRLAGMVSSSASTVAEYLAKLPADRRAALSVVRRVIKKHLPRGFVETMQYGMVAYVIPLSRYPKTYNKQPLTVAALASQKNYLSVYLMGVYADPALARWFESSWAKSGKKLDMGKSCVRFRSAEDLALDVLGKVIARVTAEDLIAQHDAVHGSARTQRASKAPPTKRAARKKSPRRRSAATGARPKARPRVRKGKGQTEPKSTAREAPPRAKRRPSRRKKR